MSSDFARFHRRLALGFVFLLGSPGIEGHECALPFLLHWLMTCAVSADGLEMCEFWNERV